MNGHNFKNFVYYDRQIKIMTGFKKINIMTVT